MKPDKKAAVLPLQQPSWTFGLDVVLEDLCLECGKPALGHHHLSADAEAIVKELKRVQPARVPIAVPGLADVLADPSVLDRLPVEALIALRRRVRGLDADIERAISLGFLSHTQNHDDVAVLTPAALAERWGVSEAKAREMYRAALYRKEQVTHRVWRKGTKPKRTKGQAP